MVRLKSRKLRVTASAKQSTIQTKTKPASSRVSRRRAQTAALRAQTPEPLREPDYDFIKIILVAVLSQILYGRLGLFLVSYVSSLSSVPSSFSSRGCFPPRNFQSLSVEDLSKYNSLQDILQSGEGMDRLDRSKLLERETTMMLRQSNDRKLNAFMSTLASALPLIDKKQLLKLRIPMTSSKYWTSDCLIEFWTVYFNYRDDGVCCLNVWRGGSDQYQVAEDTTRSCLWQVGTYLAQLPQISRPFYVTQLFTSQARPEGFGGDWDYSSVEFDDAKLHLVQQQGYCFQKVASLDVSPMNDDISTPSPEGPFKLKGMFGQGPKAQNNPPVRAVFADFASTDEVCITEDADGPRNIIVAEPTGTAARETRRGHHLVEPPIETPPSDMEETQEVVPPPPPRRWQKRGLESILNDRGIPASGGDQSQTDPGNINRERKISDGPGSKRPRRGEWKPTGREGSIPSASEHVPSSVLPGVERKLRHRLEQSFGEPADLGGNSSKTDTSKENARRMLASHMGRLAKLKSEHMQKENARA
ncbi:hypothetical protein GQ53DRAFT_847824 [Thozetella sp. PMI_491]|nr:hypothetical protein GQ53DRAFT_847824 [Thozetella sp. PMI_491]